MTKRWSRFRILFWFESHFQERKCIYLYVCFVVLYQKKIQTKVSSPTKMHNFYIKYNFQMSNHKFPHAYMATKLHVYEVCVINTSMRHVTEFQCYALSMAWKSWQRGHFGLPVDLHTQGTRPLIFLIPPPPLSALQLLVAEHFTKRAYMQCCKPAIRQEGNSQLPRPGTCPAHFGQGVHEAIFCPFLLSTLEWFKRALSPIQIRFTTKGWSKLGAPTLQRV